MGRRLSAPGAACSFVRPTSSDSSGPDVTASRLGARPGMTTDQDTAFPLRSRGTILVAPKRFRNGATMPNITLKNIPPWLYEALTEQARSNRRSLNGEILRCLETAVGAGRRDPQALLVRIRESDARAQKPWLTDSLIREARRKGRP